MDDITVRGVTYDVEHGTSPEGDDLFTVEAFPGLLAQVGFDDDPGFADPREDCNIGTMSVSYPRYNLGDEDISKIDWAYVTGGPIDYFKNERGARVVLPLTVYEHGGITMSAGSSFPMDPQGWDTSFVGFIFDTPDGLADCGEMTDAEIETALRAEVEVYASYLEGDVTFWMVRDDESGFHESCGGYVGDREYAESECRFMLALAIESRLDELAERAEMAARGMVTR